MPWRRLVPRDQISEGINVGRNPDGDPHDSAQSDDAAGHCMHPLHGNRFQTVDWNSNSRLSRAQVKFVVAQARIGKELLPFFAVIRSA
jgi:hypothetical protein